MTLSRFVSSSLTFMRQTAPSVVATLIAAAVIAGYNHTFHLTQPRMAAMQSMGESEQPRQPVRVVSLDKKAGSTTEYITIHEVVTLPEYRGEKDLRGELGKDQSITTAAKAPAPRAEPQRTAEPRPAEPRTIERRAEPRPSLVVAVPPPVANAPLPAPTPIAAQPVAPMAPQPPMAATQPPVVIAPAMVPVEPAPVIAGRTYATIPDRQYPQRPTHEANAEDVPPPPRPQGPIGVIVNTLNPAAIFARARQFGERIEAAGNDILPNIRPQ